MKPLLTILICLLFVCCKENKKPIQVIPSNISIKITSDTVRIKNCDTCIEIIGIGYSTSEVETEIKPIEDKTLYPKHRNTTFDSNGKIISDTIQ